jgi:hypothetical protein
MSNAGEYLTMARIMGKEWREYQTTNVWGKGYTGFTEIAIKNAFETAFMAGFQAKFFSSEQ